MDDEKVRQPPRDDPGPRLDGDPPVRYGDGKPIRRPKGWKAPGPRKG